MRRAGLATGVLVMLAAGAVALGVWPQAVLGLMQPAVSALGAALAALL